MSPPASEPSPVPQNHAEDNARQGGSSAEGYMHSRDELNTLLERKNNAQDGRHGTETMPDESSTLTAQEELQKGPTARERDAVADNITRVPDEHLPSHRERQRWDLSRRFSEAMDDLLPKLATVTQKVNSYTGTDYSGVEALRREIKEQGSHPVMHTSAMANGNQRILSKPAEPPLTLRSTH
jgi:sensitive to high expression protein 9